MRWAAGFLLISSAFLKALQVLTDPGAVFVGPLGSFFTFAQVALQFAIGTVVLSGAYWRELRLLVLLVFAGFAAYSLYLVLIGANSCGCFGPVHVHPLWTFLLDVVMVFALLLASPQDGPASVADAEIRNNSSTAFRIDRQKVVAIAISAGVLSIVLVVRYLDSRIATAHGVFNAKDELVILDPEQWIGQKLPIANSISLDLSIGRWVVLLHRHNCPLCQQEIPAYGRRADAGERIALIEVPPCGDSEPERWAFEQDHLRGNHEWVVRTPVEIVLQDGVVVSVKNE